MDKSSKATTPRQEIINWMINDGLIQNEESDPELVREFWDKVNECDSNLTLQQKYSTVFIDYIQNQHND